MIDLKQYGYIKTQSIPHGLIPGRVTELRREQYTVMTAYGEVTAILKGSFYHNAAEREDFPCVGDFVTIKRNESGTSLITELLPRRSKFSRADFSGHAAGYVKTILEQVVATNFDYIFILTSLNQDFKISRIMRYLSQARQSGGEPVVILTKADLVEDYISPLQTVQEIAPNVPVHVISTFTGFGISELKKYLKPEKTIVFLGMSGVGKSSLLNALMGERVMTVKNIREDDSRGRHTTTHRQLFMLPPYAEASSGAMIIDTPGMREIGLISADEGISAGFSDIEDLFERCRFTDCQHKTEPGCAILAAIKDDSLPLEKWENYLSQKQESKFADDKAGYLRGKNARHKSIAKHNKGAKKRRVTK